MFHQKHIFLKEVVPLFSQLWENKNKVARGSELDKQERGEKNWGKVLRGRGREGLTEEGS